MKILFLDIDGVLNSHIYDRNRDWTKQTDIDESRLPLLKEIVEATNAKIVLSSTWRVHWEKEEAGCDEDGRYINRIFAQYGLTVYDKTPDLGRGAARREEIGAWLSSAAEVERFVVLDDYRYDWGDLSERVVITDPNRQHGLEREHVEKAIALL